MDNIREFFESADSLSRDRVITRDELLTLHNKLQNWVEWIEDSEISEVFSETKNNLTEFFNDTLRDMLKNGYFIESRIDYDNLANMLNSSTLWYTLKPFDELRRWIQRRINARIPWFMVFFDDNWNQREDFLSLDTQNLLNQEVERTDFAWDFTQRVEQVNLQRDVQNLNDSNSEIQTQLEQLRNEIAELRSDSLLLEQRLNTLSNRRDSVNTFYHNLSWRIDELNTRLSNIERSWEIKSHNMSFLNNGLQRLRFDLSTLRETFNQQNQWQQFTPQIIELNSSNSTQDYTQTSNIADIQDLLQPDIDTIHVPVSNHTVKSWENLWNIVRNHYRLSNNSEIARMVNLVSESQSNQRLRNRLVSSVNNWVMWNRLWVWDVIELPSIDDLSNSNNGNLENTNQTTLSDQIDSNDTNLETVREEVPSLPWVMIRNNDIFRDNWEVLDIWLSVLEKSITLDWITYISETWNFEIWWQIYNLRMVNRRVWSTKPWFVEVN